MCSAWLYRSQTYHISDISAQKQGNGKLGHLDSSSPLLAVTHFNVLTGQQMYRKGWYFRFGKVTRSLLLVWITKTCKASNTKAHYVKPPTLISLNRIRNAGCKMDHTIIDSFVHHPLKRLHSPYCIFRCLLQHIVKQCSHEDLGTSLKKLLQIHQVKPIVCNTYSHHTVKECFEQLKLRDVGR